MYDDERIKLRIKPLEDTTKPLPDNVVPLGERKPQIKKAEQADDAYFEAVKKTNQLKKERDERRRLENSKSVLRSYRIK